MQTQTWFLDRAREAEEELNKKYDSNAHCLIQAVTPHTVYEKFLCGWENGTSDIVIVEIEREKQGVTVYVKKELKRFSVSFASMGDTIENTTYWSTVFIAKDEIGARKQADELLLEMKSSNDNRISRITELD